MLAHTACNAGSYRMHGWIIYVTFLELESSEEHDVSSLQCLQPCFRARGAVCVLGMCDEWLLHVSVIVDTAWQRSYSYFSHR